MQNKSEMYHLGHVYYGAKHAEIDWVSIAAAHPWITRIFASADDAPKAIVSVNPDYTETIEEGIK